jgi:WD40 repeat protein
MKKYILGSVGLICSLLLLLVGCYIQNAAEQTGISLTPTLTIMAYSSTSAAETTPTHTFYLTPTTPPLPLPRGKIIFSDVQNIYMVDVQSGTLSQLTNAGVYFSPAWTQSGYIYFTDGNKLQRISLDSQGSPKVIIGNGYVGNFAVSLAGDLLAFASGEGITLLEFNQAGEIMKRIVLNRNLPTESLVWSNDGKKLAFLEWPDNENSHDLAAFGSLYIVDADGQNIQQVSAGNLRISTHFPSWSPDGNDIVIPMKDRFGTNLYEIALDNNDFRSITNAPGNASYPSWSPDGKRILYSNNNELRVINIDGRSPRTITDKFAIVGRGYQAVWSPDGNYIAFVSQKDNLQFLNIIPVEGREGIQLITDHDFYHIDNLSWIEVQ